MDDYERFYFLSELNLEGSMRENLMTVIKKNEQLFELIDESLAASNAMHMQAQCTDVNKHRDVQTCYKVSGLLLKENDL